MTRDDPYERPIELRHREDVARSEIRVKVASDGAIPPRMPLVPAERRANAFPDWPTKQ